MSKQRPSRSTGEPVRIFRTGAFTGSTGYWQKRVFKNTYTRDGQCLEVKRWSVKIQHRGRRRTFSLTATNRASAAVEAQAIYQTIVAQGWDALPPVAPGRNHRIRFRDKTETEPLPKTEVDYWKPRLLRRRYSVVASLTAGEGLSVRIEHAGVSHYFPLGTFNESSAAARAREIYLTVVKEGWEAVSERFPRELTAAIHWAENPLAWTYATFHTAIAEAPPNPSSAARMSRRQVKVAVIEPDIGVRRALASCVNRQSGFACTAKFASAQEALREIPRCAIQLALVSRAISDVTPGEFSRKLSGLAPGLPRLFFTIHEDSDQLFRATPGGASGYLLRRTPLDRLLEPIGDRPRDELFSAERIAAQVRQYFQNVVLHLSSGEPARDLAGLTQREHEILHLLSKGFLDKEIAESLSISIWTVHGHLKKIFDKLGVHTRTEAAIKYLHK